MRKLFGVLAVLMLTVTNVTVLAAEAAAEAAGDAVPVIVESGTDIWALIAQLSVVALQIFTPALMALGSYAAYKLAKKFGIDLGAAEKAMVEEYIEKAIEAVEKWAKSKAKAGDKPSSEDKLAKAIDYATTFLATSGLKKKGTDYITALVEAKLNAKDEADAAVNAVK